MRPEQQVKGCYIETEILSLIVPLVGAGWLPVSGWVWPVMSCGQGGQLDEGIVAQRCHGFQGYVAGALHGPLIVLFEEDGTDEPNDGLVIGEDADDLGAALDLAVHALDRVG